MSAAAVGTSVSIGVSDAGKSGDRRRVLAVPSRSMAPRALAALLVLSLVACGDDGSSTDDGGTSGTDAAIPDGGSPARDGGSPDTDGAVPSDGGVDAGATDAGAGECNDGIDNDGDGLVDWQFDVGCWGPGDGNEGAGTRDQEAGWTTYDLSPESRVIYVSNEGDDDNDGLSPDDAIATLSHGMSLVRDGEHDFLLLRRGDRWRDEHLRRFPSGADAAHPMVIGAYGDGERPTVEISAPFLNHDGAERNNFAIVGIHIYAYELDPDNADFVEGADSPVVRWVGTGHNLLIEDCHFEYAGIVVQGCCDNPDYEDVEVRRNVVERHYHANTCTTGSMFRPSGIYSSHVDGLLIEENLFDHNGWNREEVPSACATIYNHNAYLSGHDIHLRGNVFSRASSIQVKMRSDGPGVVAGLLGEDNFFVEGEIGFSIGGNSEGAGRFVDTTLRDNVFTDIGRSRPTERSLGWGIEFTDNDGALVEGNLMLNARTEGVTNTYAIRLGNVTTDYTIRNNLFYRLQNQAMTVASGLTASGVMVSENEFVQPEFGGVLIAHRAGFEGFTYANNRYYTSGASDRWFRTGSYVAGSDWLSESGETGAVFLTMAPSYPDPDRDLESYSTSIGTGSTLAEFIAVARLQSRQNWRSDLMAHAINEYIRAGFDR